MANAAWSISIETGNDRESIERVHDMLNGLIQENQRKGKVAISVLIPCEAKLPSWNELRVGDLPGKPRETGATLDAEFVDVDSINLSEDESLLKMYGEATLAFGSGDRAWEWLTTPCPALGDLPPKRFVATETGRRQIIDELRRIEHGIY